MKRGGQVVGSLIGNFEAVDKALYNMENAAGSADREMSVIQDSIDYKLNALKQTWVGVAQDLIDRGVAGGIIDFLTTISELIKGITSSSEGLKIAFAGISSVLMSRKGIGKRKNSSGDLMYRAHPIKVA